MADLDGFDENEFAEAFDQAIECLDRLYFPSNYSLEANLEPLHSAGIDGPRWPSVSLPPRDFYRIWWGDLVLRAFDRDRHNRLEKIRSNLSMRSSASGKTEI